MKTNVHKLTGDENTLECILDEAQKSAEYNGLGKKQSLQLRLLAEELIGMLPELLEIGDGEFWIENNGAEYELHAALSAEKLDFWDREKILSVSTSGKNAASKGIVSKLRLIARKMLDGYSMSIEMSNSMDYQFYDMGSVTMPMYSEAWSLNSYRDSSQVKSSEDDWDELEKSVIANVADDVIIGVIGKKVDIVIKKKFN